MTRDFIAQMGQARNPGLRDQSGTGAHGWASTTGQQTPVLDDLAETVLATSTSTPSAPPQS